MSMSKSMEKMGQPIAYYPKKTKFLGSVTASIFYSYFLNFSDEKCKFGICKTAEEIFDGTGLSIKQQRTARKILRGLGMLKETHKRLEHKIYYLINEPAKEGL